MNNRPEIVPVAYENPREWLEGKRRFVRLLRRFCGVQGDGWHPGCGGAQVDRDLLEAALNWHEEQHEVRVAATRAAGIRLPMDEFAAEFELDDVEREVIELLLVEQTDLMHEDGRGLPVGELALLLSRGNQDAAQQYLPYFLPGSRLLDVVSSREMLGSLRLSIDDDMMRLLLATEGAQSEARSRPAASAESWQGDIGEFLNENGVVVSASTLEAIRALWGLIRREKLISEEWGFGSLKQLPSGVCVLFHGSPGTGKTMTAHCLCRALGREPLVVNYADLVSKWVGETEKNTRAAFAEAAKTGRVLVFDEADAVFTRRTDVRHSTDRFANSEVNTLLMELEQFAGIVILTTNHAGVLDPALERRIRFKVHFGIPDAAARARIWRAHIPRQAPLAPDVDLVRLAQEYKLTGGQIANAVVTAASLAAARLENNASEGTITMADFEAAARREAKGWSAAERNGRLGF